MKAINQDIQDAQRLLWAAFLTLADTYKAAGDSAMEQAAKDAFNETLEILGLFVCDECAQIESRGEIADRWRIGLVCKRCVENVRRA